MNDQHFFQGEYPGFTRKVPACSELPGKYSKGLDELNRLKLSE
jgi:hypothetical protein